MRLDIHVHDDEEVHGRLDRIEQLLSDLKQQSERIVIMTKEEAKRLDTLSTAIKTRMQALLDKITELSADALTSEEKAEIEADFVTLENLGKDPNAPIPTT